MLCYVCFSLRRYKPNQVQRDYLNSFQNTPKAITNVSLLYEDYEIATNDFMKIVSHVLKKYFF